MRSRARARVSTGCARTSAFTRCLAVAPPELESTGASAAVGVAISVTTIPASAYLGVAIGGGGIDEALGALVVLVINVGLLIVGGSLTLLAQRILPNRSGAPV